MGHLMVPEIPLYLTSLAEQSKVIRRKSCSIFLSTFLVLYSFGPHCFSPNLIISTYCQLSSLPKDTISFYSNVILILVRINHKEYGAAG
jgi:hypothetical protein